MHTTSTPGALKTPALYHTGIKILTLLLLSLSILIGCLSSAITVIMGENGFYLQSYEKCREELFCRIAHASAVRLSDTLYGDFRYLYDSEQAKDYPITDTLNEREEFFPNIIAADEQLDENLFITVLDQDGKIIFTNGTVSSPLYEEEVEALHLALEDGTQVIRTILCSIPSNLSRNSGGILSILEGLLPHLWALRGWIIVFALEAWICAGILFFLLLMAAGHFPGERQVRLWGPARLPMDVVTALTFIAGCLVLELASITLISPTFYRFAILALASILGIPLGIGYVMCLAANVKCHTLWKRSLLARTISLLLRWIRWIGRRILIPLWRGIVRIISCLPLLYKTVIGLGIAAIAEFLVLLCTENYFSLLITFWVIRECIMVPLILLITMSLRELQKGGQKLAAGDLQYQIRTRGMVGDFRRHADNLNSISLGMARAVEERTKSDRMRTELITNVSHDLKTPLTSVINYVDLLRKAPTGSPEAAEYLNILDRQSTRLKKLIEDLLEVSKASTGNLNVELTPVATDVLLSQAVGEYEEPLQAAELEAVLRKPDTSPVVLADGRLLWRVFDNLLSNIVKYALPGTRVYLDIRRCGDCAQLVFRNISREPLNITAEDLMERFVRGDSSRHTEGNGLGLSIARGLCDSMNGKMELDLDGDLFKVTLTFPIYHPPAETPNQSSTPSSLRM